jgi:preprotein translocase subunit SecG
MEEILITVLILLTAIFLVLIVLVQNSKGGGLAAGFSSSNQVLGVRKTTDFLEKATWGAAAILIVLCIAITHYNDNGRPASQESDVLQNVSLPVQQNVPDFGTPVQPGETTPQPALPVPQP